MLAPTSTKAFVFIRFYDFHLDAFSKLPSAMALFPVKLKAVLCLRGVDACIESSVTNQAKGARPNGPTFDKRP